MIDSNAIQTLPGAKVVDPDGDKIGTVKQVYVSDDGGQPLFVTVNTGLFGTKESFVPLTSADFDEGTLRIAYDKSTVKDAPNVDADGAISDDEQDSIFDYSEGKGGTPAGFGATTGSDRFTTGSDTSRTGTDRSTTTGSGFDTTGRGADAGVGAAGTGAGVRGTDTSSNGYDTSGPTTDDAMTRSEERLNVGTQKVETGRARLRKHVVTEQQTVNVPVSHDEVRIEREPITDANRGAATAGPDLSDEEHEVVLTEERPVVDKETVPVERVRLDKETVTGQQQVTEDVRSERIDTDGAEGTGRR
jgi:uncharacterized protein (TIGR02271 family)